MYRVFWKNCVITKHFHYFATTPLQPLLGWFTKIGQIGQPIGVTGHSYCVETFESWKLKAICRRGLGCSGLLGRKKCFFEYQSYLKVFFAYSSDQEKMATKQYLPDVAAFTCSQIFCEIHFFKASLSNDMTAILRLCSQ